MGLLRLLCLWLAFDRFNLPGKNIQLLPLRLVRASYVQLVVAVAAPPLARISRASINSTYKYKYSCTTKSSSILNTSDTGEEVTDFRNCKAAYEGRFL
jgi:hypothetical protein